MPLYLHARCRYIQSRALHGKCLTFVRSFQFSIISIEDSTPQALATAKLYYNNVDFALMLRKEFAAAERSNAEL